MGNQLNINLTKFKSKRTKIKGSAKDVKEADTGVNFGTYSVLNPNTKMKEVYKTQKSQTKDYFLQVKEDIQIMREIVAGFENIDSYGASKMKFVRKK